MFFYISLLIHVVIFHAFLDWRLNIFGKYKNPLSGIYAQNKMVKWDRSVPTLFFSATHLYVLFVVVNISQKLRAATVAVNTEAGNDVTIVKPSIVPEVFSVKNGYQYSKILDENTKNVVISFTINK